ncbi:MAG: hypothetical protein KGS09_07745 [Nitrospirae bacterium]|nr:hypothetical protein [Nitrospirota bacterium]MDE3039700.1 hypothetical protein [Nitrospirota bacterium]
MSSLPVETKLIGDVLAGQSLSAGQGLFQPGPQAIAKLESQVRIAQ